MKLKARKQTGHTLQLPWAAQGTQMLWL